MKTIVIVGATGDVGKGLVAELTAAGNRVVAVGRSAERLQDLTRLCAAPGQLVLVTGDVNSLAGAETLATALAAQGDIDVIIATVNGQFLAVEARTVTAAALDEVFQANVATHVNAAQALVPLLKSGGLYLSIGGGMADLVFPGRVAVSMGQAAQRVYFRYLAGEWAKSGVTVKELMLYSMIAGERTEAEAEAHWITASEVGRHVLAILAEPALFEGDIVTLKSRKQVGFPQKPA